MASRESHAYNNLINLVASAMRFRKSKAAAVSTAHLDIF